MRTARREASLAMVAAADTSDKAGVATGDGPRTVQALRVWDELVDMGVERSNVLGRRRSRLLIASSGCGHMIGGGDASP